ncbi:hypothetical protein Btru_054170 [Bulinus truncatus]|nr:hypothetical protein Btru_054170 [Bulinus truncatus]
MFTAEGPLVKIWFTENASTKNITVYQDEFYKFKQSFLERNTTQILLKYDTDNLKFTHIKYIFPTHNKVDRDSYFTCFHNASNSTIQCDKKNSNDNCNHAVSSSNDNKTFGIYWKNNSTFMESELFQNSTRICSDRVNVTNYTFSESIVPSTTESKSINQNTNQFTTYSTSPPLDKSTSSVGIIAGVVVSVTVVGIVVIVILVIWKRKKDDNRKSGTNIDPPIIKSENFYDQRTLHTLEPPNRESKDPNQSEYLQKQSQTFTITGRTLLKNKEEKSVGSSSCYGYPMSLVESDYAGIGDGHDELQLVRSKVDDPEDNYNYIHGDIPNRDSGVSNSINVYHTVDDCVEINEIAPIRDQEKLQSYNNIVLENKENDLKETKNEYSKLREKIRSFDNTYGDLNNSLDEEVIDEGHNSEEQVTDETDNALSNTYFVLTAEDYDSAKNSKDKK